MSLLPGPGISENNARRFGRLTTHSSNRGNRLVLGLALAGLALVGLSRRTSLEHKKEEQVWHHSVSLEPVKNNPIDWDNVPTEEDLDNTEKSTGPSDKQVIEEWWEVFKKGAEPSEKYDHETILGLFDSDALLPVFSRLWKHPSQQSKLNYFIDIGANVGLTSQLFVQYFTGYTCLQNKALAHSECDEAPNGGIHAFEPGPGTFKILKRRGSKGNWTSLANWHPHALAISGSVGQMTFYVGAEKGSEQSSLDKEAAGEDAKEVQVNVTTMDHWLSNESGLDLTKSTSKDVELWLYKIDTEGFDMEVLNGSKDILKRHLAKFIVFEYNHKWFLNNRTFTLEQTVENLYKNDYLCFFIEKDNLVPMNGPWWVSGHEIKKWSNVFCSRNNDKDLIQVLLGYNRETNLTLKWMKLAGINV